jgi:hypothetical protein
MDNNMYNTRVRQAISDEIIKCSKQKREYRIQHAIVVARLASEQNTLPYSEYKKLEQEREFLVRMQEVEKIKLDVWDTAREICLNIADEFK